MMPQLADALGWARVVVRTIKDMGLAVPGDAHVLEAAWNTVDEIKEIASNPGQCDAEWLRHDKLSLLGWAEKAERRGQPERARAYEAIVAARVLAAEACERKGER